MEQDLEQRRMDGTSGPHLTCLSLSVASPSTYDPYMLALPMFSPCSSSYSAHFPHELLQEADTSQLYV